MRYVIVLAIAAFVFGGCQSDEPATPETPAAPVSEQTPAVEGEVPDVQAVPAVETPDADAVVEPAAAAPEAAFGIVAPPVTE